MTIAKRECLALVLLSWVLAMPFLHGELVVTQVDFLARHPWNGLVDITYAIECNEVDLRGNRYHFLVSFEGRDRVMDKPIAMSTVSGPGVLIPVAAGGPYRVVWAADKDCPEFSSAAFDVKIKVKAVVADDPSRKYLVIDLSGGPSAKAYPCSFLSVAPAGGWTDDYKKDKLVLRRIPAGAFDMGSPENELGVWHDVEALHPAALTQDLYVGVFEVTQWQWERVMGNWPSHCANPAYRDTRPVEQVSYHDIRGAGVGAGWPASDAVDADSFLGRLRAKAGQAFDLPTEAQWEYACRAGTTTALNSGKDLTNDWGCPNMSEVGRYAFNRVENTSRDVNTTGGTAKVGSYQPNQWGLYDMHGNVREWCLDWWDWNDHSPQAVTDPKGLERGEVRMIRGGGWCDGAGNCRSAARIGGLQDGSSWDHGLRIVLTAPAVTPVKHTVEFDLGEHGTRTGGGQLVQEVKHGGSAVAPQVKPAPGWRFVGWSPDLDLASVNTSVAYKAQYEFEVKAEQYLVIDLSGGPTATSYPLSTLSAPPASGWTDVYKTTKLVLRKISAGTFYMGSPANELGREEDETRHLVTLTKDYYIGVFEVTQKQWELVMGNWPSYYANASYRQTRPVEQVSYDDIRGPDAGSGWPASNDVDANSFLGRLRAKTGLTLDLPTEAQWEYACRAGTTTALNSGKNLTAKKKCPNMTKVGRYYYSMSEYAYTAAVGSYSANQWGLYDMHGNVWEICLDWYEAIDYSSEAVTDPIGLDAATWRARRGGAFVWDAMYCRSANRGGTFPGLRDKEDGFRLASALPPVQ
ncbi:MAG: Serine/threonine-protein kinase pkn1 [Lentisphaerae bacterium ADurb.Bin082]|nr:MAG: Serine/threonine-protein kinase pkn1 [Lentisphaerae bacterium ADurb.Bin082]HQL86964.1 formylglycine-generating enzyme family protein [Lentisphaeria bacterium]